MERRSEGRLLPLGVAGEGQDRPLAVPEQARLDTGRTNWGAQAHTPGSVGPASCLGDGLTGGVWRSAMTGRSATEGAGRVGKTPAARESRPRCAM